MKKSIFIILITSLLLASCRNNDFEFPDYDYTAAYFANQYPIRKITLGESYVFDNSLDNEHKCQILATVGGFREIKKDIEITFRVDNSLCDPLANVKPMPENYYTLSDNSKMIIKKGSKMLGGVTVQLTEAFFADKDALTNTYVIPLLMTDVKNADRLLSGTPAVENPNRFVATDWSAAPKDFILYAIKYINQWDGMYLRQGVDNVTSDGQTSTIRRDETVIEKAPVTKLNSLSFYELEYPLDYETRTGVNLGLNIKLTFDNNNRCTVAPLVTVLDVNATTRVLNITATGQGEYKKGTEKWGNESKNRDAIYLDFEVNYQVEVKNQAGEVIDLQTVKYQTTDKLVLRDRVEKGEYFTPVLK